MPQLVLEVPPHRDRREEKLCVIFLFSLFIPLLHSFSSFPFPVPDGLDTTLLRVDMLLALLYLLAYRQLVKSSH